MSVDYQVLSFRDTAPLTEVGVFDLSPLTLDIRGRDFRDVSEVLINGIRSREVIILTPRRLLAQVPRSQLSAPTTSVSVLSARSGTSPRAVISLTAVVPRSVATGRTRMVQSYLKLLLTSPGSDIFRPQDGAGLLDSVGQAATPSSLRTSTSVAISDAQSQLVRIQSQDSRLEDSERLRSATLLSSDFSPSQGSLSIRLRLTAVDGSTSDASLIV